MAHLGRRLRDSGSVIDQSQLPSPSGSYHLEPFLAEPSDHRSMTDSTLASAQKQDGVSKFVNFDTPSFLRYVLTGQGCHLTVTFLTIPPAFTTYTPGATEIEVSPEAVNDATDTPAGV